jgi:predicted O-linked N-acetylglucosamine transferase (SPINDLY family)
LPEGRSLYACPQSLFKFHPDDDLVIRGILEADSQSVLVVIEGRVAAWTDRLKARWQRTLGSLLERVIFLPAQSHDNYLRLLQECDVILDPLHFGGGNSSYEALAMGTPVVTMPSSFLRGRITSALYRRMQWMDCVVKSIDDYVAVAVRIATDKAYQQSLRSQILGRSPVLFESREEIECLEKTLLSLSGKPRA